MVGKYERPNYEKLYPGLEIPKEVMQALLDSDYKMEYAEHDLKVGRLKKDEDESGGSYTPSREISYDWLLDTQWQFTSADIQPENAWLDKEEVAELRRCIGLLSADEQALVNALFYRGLLEQEYANELGVTQQAVSKRKRRILKKIKKFLTEGCITP